MQHYIYPQPKQRTSPPTPTTLPSMLRRPAHWRHPSCHFGHSKQYEAPRVFQAYRQLRMRPHSLQHTLQSTSQGVIQRPNCWLTPQSQRCSLGTLTDDPQRSTHTRALPGLPQQHLPRSGQRPTTFLDQSRPHSPTNSSTPRPRLLHCYPPHPTTTLN